MLLNLIYYSQIFCLKIGHCIYSNIFSSFIGFGFLNKANSAVIKHCRVVLDILVSVFLEKSDMKERCPNLILNVNKLPLIVQHMQTVCALCRLKSLQLGCPN